MIHRFETDLVEFLLARVAEDRRITWALYQGEIDRAQQEAAQSEPLASAQAQQAVLVEQARVAQRKCGTVCGAVAGVRPRCLVDVPMPGSAATHTPEGIGRS